MVNKVNDFFMKDWTFILIAMMICAGVVGSAHTFLYDNVGYLNGLLGGSLLREGMETGDFSAAVGYGGGFLIARVLEGPLVGLIDIGGGMMHGVGCGIVALLFSVGAGFLIENFVLAVITGAGIGLIIGLIVMGVRKLVPEGISAGGTGIMMGVGHQLSAYLAPLFLLSAWGVSIPIGIAGTLGGVIFYLRGKNALGGIIICMFVAAFFFPLAQ